MPARRRTAFLEALASFRPLLDVLAAFQAVENTNEPIPRPRVPAEWYQARAVGRLRLGTHQRWLDLRSFETREALRHELARTPLDLGFEDPDLSEVVGPKRQFTQTIARWAYDHGYAGLVYSSRFDATLTCWTTFEGAAFARVGILESILAGDPDLAFGGPIIWPCYLAQTAHAPTVIRLSLSLLLAVPSLVDARPRVRSCHPPPVASR